MLSVIVDLVKVETKTDLKQICSKPFKPVCRSVSEPSRTVRLRTARKFERLAHKLLSTFPQPLVLPYLYALMQL